MFSNDHLFLSEHFSLLNGRLPQVPSLFIRADYGQFGNVYITIKKAILIARHFKLAHVFVDHRCSMFDFQDAFVTAFREEHLESEKLVKLNEGAEFLYFFDVSQYTGPRGIHIKSANRILSDALVYDRHLELPPGALVIHIRSGDIFDPQKHCPGYAQPPLAWYKACIQCHKERYGSAFLAILVFENEANPCIRPLIEWCGQENIPLKIQSSSINEDYSYIMNAHALVDSVGTFLLPAKELSKKLQINYSFNFDGCTPGSYCKPGDWEASDAQKSAMLSIPLEDLHLPEDLFGISHVDHAGYKDNSCLSYFYYMG